MHDVLAKAISIIRTANVSDADKAALDEIEKAYPVKRVKTLHKFMLQLQKMVETQSLERTYFLQTDVTG